MSDFDDLIRQIQGSQELVPRLKGMGLAFDLANSIATPSAIVPPALSFANRYDSILSSLHPLSDLNRQLTSYRDSVYAMGSSLAPWLRSSPNSGALASSILSSYTGLFSGLSILQSQYGPERLDPFGELAGSLQRAIDKYTAHLGVDTADSDVEDLDTVLSSTAAPIIEQARNGVQLTEADVERIALSVSEKLTPVLSTRRGARIATLIVDACTILGFLVAIYSQYRSETLSNEGAVIDLAHDKQLQFIGGIVADVRSAVGDQLRISHFRTTTSVHLRSSPSLDASVLLTVPTDQEVVAAWPSQGWLLVSYLDSASCIVYTGYVNEQYVTPIQ